MLSFSHPLLLWALFPWAALAAYMFTGRPREVLVPFLDLWPKKLATSPFSVSLQRPPGAIIAGLLAVLLAIVAAAGPAVGHGRSVGPIVMIVDRGLTMSARRDNEPAYFGLTRQAVAALTRTGGGAVQLIIVPGNGTQLVDLPDVPNRVGDFAPTAADTQGELEAAAQAGLRDAAATVVVVSNRPIAESDARIIRVAPAGRFTNVAIADLAVRTAPTAQAMVRILNDSPLSQATLHITGAADQLIKLPTTGTFANYFVDLTEAPAVVEASVEPAGDITADSTAWSVRGGGWPKLFAGTALPPEMARMVSVYGRHRPPQEKSPIITIAAISSEDPKDQAAVYVVTDGTPTIAVPTDLLTIEPGSPAAGIDWAAAIRDGQLSQIQPDTDWQPIVRSGKNVLVAIRASPARQIWVGFRSPGWAATPDFVIFWTKAFDWIGSQTGDGGGYAATSISQLDPEWKPLHGQSAPADAGLWPGVYTRGDQTIAVNAVPPPQEVVQSSDWQTKLADLPASGSKPQDLGVATAIGAIVCLLIAVIASPSVQGERSGIPVRR
jgi:hypothetical protein